MVFDDTAPLPAVIRQPRSRRVRVRWAELPGFRDDALHEAWNAWLKSCERPLAAFAALCPEIRLLSLADEAEQRRWMFQRLQPYRVEAPATGSEGLLTAYFEPMLQASAGATTGIHDSAVPPSGTTGGAQALVHAQGDGDFAGGQGRVARPRDSLAG